jgi:hypothetical protein
VGTGISNEVADVGEAFKEVPFDLEVVLQNFPGV